MRIILADSNEVAIRALRTLLLEEPGMAICGEATDAQQVRQMAERTWADLILLDREVARTEMEPLISDLHALGSRPVVIGMSTDPGDGRLMLRAGADVFVSKGDQPDWLLEILRRYAKRINERSKPA